MSDRDRDRNLAVLEELSTAQGVGTSMVTLLIPGSDSL